MTFSGDFHVKVYTRGLTVTPPPPLKKNEFLTEEIHGYATHCSIDVIYVFGEYKQEEKKESVCL